MDSVNLDCLRPVDHLSEDREQVSDHSNISDDEISRTGMCFDSLEEAHDFYKNYTEKVGCVIKIRNTNHVINAKGEKIPINQSIHCNREGNRTSRAKAPRRSKKIATAMCNARVYVKFNKDNSKWFYSIVEGKHSHHCSPEKSIQYHDYRHLSMHAKYVIEDNDEAGI
ncbi:hypothetical protein PIB30_060741 [Stylosanthes scabra]|uniref:FAR1 domain-containing protein n=1 Tax=Stylosanthes scabra TaxID=79078 RepID=A0ABU6SM03_9FABA|nr:hypothetical protein [Stylosanthes scabra]